MRRMGRGEDTGIGVVWIKALESTTQSVMAAGGVKVIVLNELARDCWSHALARDIQDVWGNNC